MLYGDVTYKIRECIFDVYNKVGPGFNEETYELMLRDALCKNGLKTERQKEFEVYYKYKRVGLYRTDLIVGGKIILELKATPEILPLHKAQVISYLKLTNLQLGMLVNFGSDRLYIKAFPNKNYKDNFNQGLNAKSIEIAFSTEKINLLDEDIKLISPFLLIAKEISEMLGPGYFHQVYRRAFWYEMNWNRVGFELIKQVVANYGGRVYQVVDVKLFRIDDLLIFTVAVVEIDKLLVRKFINFMKKFNCQKGLIINFNSLVLDFRFFKI